MVSRLKSKITSGIHCRPKATAKDVEEYIQQKLDYYVEIDLSGTELYGEWKADFINFTVSTFNKNRESAKNLRDFLRKNGLCVRKSRKAIAEELANNPEEGLNKTGNVRHGYG